MVERRIVSASELRAMGRCGEEWHRTYVLGRRNPGSPKMIRGSAAHKANAAILRAKRDGSPYPVEMAKDVARDSFDAIVASEGFRLTGKDVEEFGGANTALGFYRDRAVQYAELYTREVVPGITPQDVELEVATSEPVEALGGAYVTGVLDVVDAPAPATLVEPQRVIIRDTKTAARKKSLEEVHGDIGLTMYAFLEELRSGRPPDGVRLDNLVITPAGQKVYVQEDLPTIRKTRADISGLVESMRRLVAIREAGLVPPPAVTGRDWWCSQSSCPHTSECPFYNRAADSAA